VAIRGARIVVSATKIIAHDSFSPDERTDPAAQAFFDAGQQSVTKGYESTTDLFGASEYIEFMH
jgi:hypothetical protein